MRMIYGIRKDNMPKSCAVSCSNRVEKRTGKDVRNSFIDSIPMKRGQSSMTCSMSTSQWKDFVNALEHTP